MIYSSQKLIVCSEVFSAIFCYKAYQVNVSQYEQESPIEQYKYTIVQEHKFLI